MKIEVCSVMPKMMAKLAAKTRMTLESFEEKCTAGSVLQSMF